MSWLKTTLESVAAKGKSMAGAVADGALKKIGSLLGPGAAPAVRMDAAAGTIKDFQAAVSGVGTENNNNKKILLNHIIHIMCIPLL